ncbi:SDR family NAD(P)-dependent oxidoreductase [Martelella radicis]|uniref:NAD(P)-dependent dehydrogenase (Short-subunit alcohol dehydrogenase family) n=1 Tax=Martelella radicis TaxID=1397476 RepID=A0A7W6PAW6_9HYPH|nr:SDR family oxidoreductase [Martelella radicis]MBB4122034.1 NAD(P)-dependent dehydrogenase (short-subunit alcohol dehydrogenase family) [Martelella radicis]
MTDPRFLSGRRALVTGADQGIGRAIARALDAAGATVVLHHLNGAAGARETLAAAETHEADFTEAGAAAGLAARVLEGGPLDILIANAAIEQRGPWQSVTEETVNRHVEANFTSFLTLCQALVPPMAERGWGRVVAVGSIMAARPRAETLVYAALKSAQYTALAAIARDVAGSGVTLNAIAPGAIETERTASRYADPDFRNAVTAKIPAGRQGRPDDCVAPVLMFCSDQAAYITGATVPVDGGWSLGDAPGGLPGERT